MTELKTDRYNLHYEVIDLTPPWIEAPDTIFFHHGVGANWQCWLGWVAQLQDRYRLLAFDMPGHGQSHPGDPAITIADLVVSLIALADAVDCSKFHLVGESIGGTVALQAALDHPDRLSSLTISNGSHIGGSIENVQNWDVHGMYDRLLSLGYRMDRGYGRLKGKVFRIPHMGNIYMDDLKIYLNVMDTIICQ